MQTPTPADSPPRPSKPKLSAHTVTTDRTVITEENNTDGWIASDLTVPLAE
jgi:hypothetical protein